MGPRSCFGSAHWPQLWITHPLGSNPGAGIASSRIIFPPPTVLHHPPAQPNSCRVYDGFVAGKYERADERENPFERNKATGKLTCYACRTWHCKEFHELFQHCTPFCTTLRHSPTAVAPRHRL